MIHSKFNTNILRRFIKSRNVTSLVNNHISKSLYSINFNNKFNHLRLFSDFNDKKEIISTISKSSPY